MAMCGCGDGYGPVARTVRTLVDKGLLARAANPRSRRADLITVTATGRQLLKNDPRMALAAAIDAIPLDQQEAIALAMEALLNTLLDISHSNERHDDYLDMRSI